MTRRSNIGERYRARFDGAPRVYRAPGRVNLIGEHTDYNDGFAMPAAIEFYCWVAIGPRARPFQVTDCGDMDEREHLPGERRPKVEGLSRTGAEFCDFEAGAIQ